MLTDGLIRAFQIVEGHQTLVVIHLSEELSCLHIPTCLVKGASIDILHHVFIDGLDVLAGCLLPELDVLGVAVQQHVTAHEQQTVLRAQACSQLRLCIGPHGGERLVALGYLLFGGIVPRIPDLVAALQVFL